MTNKIKVRSVEIHRAEGPSHLCITRTAGSFAEANRILRENAETAPKGGAYDKHDVTVTFEDGETYEARMDYGALFRLKVSSAHGSYRWRDPAQSLPCGNPLPLSAIQS